MDELGEQGTLGYDQHGILRVFTQTLRAESSHKLHKQLITLRTKTLQEL